MTEETSPLRTLKNGAVYDTSRGRIVANPPGGPTTAIKTSQQGRDMRERRRQLSAQLSRRAVADEAAAMGIQRSAPAAVAHLAALSYRSAIDNMMDKPRDAIHPAKLALQCMDILPAAAAGGGAMVNVQVNVSPELLRHWGVEIVDAETRDITDEDV